MVIVHHLQNSRSQRILWMLEELGIEYQVKRYERDAETMLAPPELEQVHPLGKSPVIEYNQQRVAESGAIIEYLGRTFGEGKMVPQMDSDNYQHYIYWLHYAEGSLMPPLLIKLIFEKIKSTKMPFFIKPVANGIANNVLGSFVAPNLKRHLAFVEQHLSQNQWFAGDDITGADIQMSFPLEAGRARGVVTSAHPHISKFVERVQSRPAYKLALEKGGPYDYS